MNKISDISNTELWLLESTLKERYGKKIDIEPGEAEIRLNPADRELTMCPVLYWRVDNCNFVVFKTGDNLYRCQFFYRLFQQYSTGRYEYDNLTECLVDLLQVQADYEAQERGEIKLKRRR
ncbi:hypothetical protein TI04_01645 [Achromatium sp. WMS2]|nr:hypothetical protein TI04_01645 [Achromatium sp. WMS2]